MKNKNIFMLFTSLMLIALCIYLFISAPIPLIKAKEEKFTFSIEETFKILAKENDITRSFYTKNIVGKGKKVNLKFDEHWKQSNVEAGPLPALFLREVSTFIEKSTEPLGLYLGSDFPISKENLFKGTQAEKFKKIKEKKKPQFFYDDNTKRYTAMFPDYASVQACVTCHNKHIQSPKKDWMINDIMGATTWTYPKDSLTTNEVLKLINIYKKGVNNVYGNYLAEVKDFKSNDIPNIGNEWPSRGYYLPSLETWKDTLNQITSPKLINSIINEK